MYKTGRISHVKLPWDATKFSISISLSNTESLSLKLDPACCLYQSIAHWRSLTSTSVGRIVKVGIWQ